MAAESSAGAANNGAARAAENAQQFAKAIEAIRQRSDYTAKVLGGIGTAAITAIGYAKLADVFPWGGPSWAAFVLGFGAVFMVLAVCLLVRRFYTASQSLITRSDLAQTKELNAMSKDEVKLVRRAYEDTAWLNGVSTLRAYEARGQRLDRVAAWLPEPQAEAIHAEAAQIFAEVIATQARAAAFVLRRRSTVALFGKGTFILLFVFVVGWYATAVSSDALQSHRTDQITVAKECAEARGLGAIVETKLPSICGPAPSPAASAAADPFELRENAVAALATARAQCREAAIKSKPPSLAECASLERAFALMQK